MPTLSAFERGLEGRTGKEKGTRYEIGIGGGGEAAKTSKSSSSDLWRVRASGAVESIAKHLINSKRLLHNLEQISSRRMHEYNYSSFMRMRCGNRPRPLPGLSVTF